MGKALDVGVQVRGMEALDRPGHGRMQEDPSRRQELTIGHIANLIVDEVELLADDTKHASLDNALDLLGRNGFLET